MPCIPCPIPAPSFSKEAARGIGGEKRGLPGGFPPARAVERLTPVCLPGQENTKAMCANVQPVFRPGVPHSRLFGRNCLPPVRRGADGGWCAHRIEELLTGGRIIRPAYKAIARPSPIFRWRIGSNGNNRPAEKQEIENSGFSFPPFCYNSGRAGECSSREIAGGRAFPPSANGTIGRVYHIVNSLKA